MERKTCYCYMFIEIFSSSKFVVHDDQSECLSKLQQLIIVILIVSCYVSKQHRRVNVMLSLACSRHPDAKIWNIIHGGMLENGSSPQTIDLCSIGSTYTFNVAVRLNDYDTEVIYRAHVLSKVTVILNYWSYWTTNWRRKFQDPAKALRKFPKIFLVIDVIPQYML